jgi:hypothetical protein
MRKKTFFWMLMLLVLSAASVNAQVRIGGLDDPNESAVLDLNATNAANDGKLGLALPRVELTSTTDFAPLKAHIVGMTVYNTKTVSDVTPGTYYNDGDKWVRIGSGTSISATGNLTINGLGTVESPYILGIANNGITTDKIADNAVTAAKLNATGATDGQVLKFNGTAWMPGTDLTDADYGYNAPSVASTGCDGSVLYIGTFDYADGTFGDAAKGVTDASNTDDHETLPTLPSIVDVFADNNYYMHNPNYYLCVYKKDGNGGSQTTWENAVNNCANGTYADGNASAGWYLPNARELAVIHENLENGYSFFGLEKYGMIVSYTLKMASNFYWSSTELSATDAWRFGFHLGTYNNPSKTHNDFVRCVKRIPAI